MTRVKNIKNRKMTREEQIPIIKQFEAHSLLMMTSLDVAMTKIRKLEEENMELKISVKEAETKISLLEREKRRANRRTVIIADSHRKAMDFDRLADFLGDLKVETAYTSRECSKARFPGRSQEKVIPQVMQNYPDTTNMIVQLCCNDLSNMRDLSDVKLMFKMAKDSTINTVEICEKAVLENKNLSILIIPRTPRADSVLLSRLTHYANDLVFQVIAEKSLQDVIKVASLESLKTTSSREITNLFGSPFDTKVDYLHLKGKLGKDLYTSAILESIALTSF